MRRKIEKIISAKFITLKIFYTKEKIVELAKSYELKFVKSTD